MSYVRVVYQDVSDSADAFLNGLEQLEQCLVSEARESFRRALSDSFVEDPYYHTYQSYFGLASLLCGEKSAIVRIRDAAVTCPADGDIHMNLARAELFLTNRKRAIDAIENGLRFSGDHLGLRVLRERVGVRRRKVIPLIPRSHPLNHFLGRWLLRKKTSIC